MFMNINQHKQKNKGAAMTLAVMFFLLISLAIVLGSVGPVVRDYKNARDLISAKESYFTAESGIEDAMYRIKKGKQIGGTVVLALNGGTTNVAISNVSSTEKQIIASGNVLSNNRNVQLNLTTGVGADFAYGAQVGEGGLVMANGSSVQGTGGAVGNVYSNGPIIGSNSAAITGSATVATGLDLDTQGSEVCNTDQFVGKTSPQIDFAQKFSPSSSLPLSRVSLYIKKVGAPSSPTIRIVADNAGSPATSALASATLYAADAGTSYSWVDVSFSSPANLVAGQYYWIVFDTGTNSSNYFSWCSDSNNGYGNGVGKYKSSWSTSGSWTQITGDLGFRNYLGAGNGSIDSVTIGGNAYAHSITDSTITGTAYCQSGSGNNKACDTSQADPPVMNMPISDATIAGWKADAAAGTIYNGNCGDSGVAGCSGSGTISIGPAKITGNLTITNGRVLNLTGVVHVAGDINISNNGTVRCDVSFGSDSCVLIADGYIDASNNAIFSGSGQSGSYILAVSTKEGCNGVSASGCASGYSGINLGNNLTGAVFYTSASMINISNNAAIKAVVGYKLNLSNNAVVTYEQGVANANFSSGPGGGWNVKSWKEVQ